MREKGRPASISVKPRPSAPPPGLPPRVARATFLWHGLPDDHSPEPRFTMPSHPQGLPTVHVHADESCLGNQFTDRHSPGGAAGLLEFWRDDTWVRRDYWLSEPDTTNNRMAIRSALEPLRLLRKPCRVVFVSDSQYLVRGMSEWLPGWKSRGWKRKSGPIENLALWKELDREAGRHSVTWEWIRGHTGHPRNEYANDLAVRAARTQNSSRGLVESGFEDWLQEQRERHQRYMDFFEHAPPDAS
jgi:ribonuclease HI